MKPVAECFSIDSVARPRDYARWLAGLESGAPLSADDREAIAGLPLRVQAFAEKADILRQGDAPRECAVVLDGFVCRYRLLGLGQRQILSFHTPGQMPDLQALHLTPLDHGLSALSAARVGFVPHAALHELIARAPAVATALRREVLVDASVAREWLVGLGRRDARQRIAHLICEVFLKLGATGDADPDGFDLPFTQLELGDALGLSSVHVNRVLQDLRRDGLIASRGRNLDICDWARLRAAGDFDAAYLHLPEADDAAKAQLSP